MTRFLLFALVMSACNPRPVACDAQRGLVDPKDKALTVEHCRIDQVCCRREDGRFSCGEVREPSCSPQAPARAN